MKKLFLLVSSLVALVPAAHAQYPVSGKVLDQQTHQPVPYASVVVAGTTQGTTSNSEGEFLLTVRQVPAKVLAFSLGYGRDSVQVTAAGPLRALVLVPAPVQLPTVEPPSYATALLANAYRELLRTQDHKEYGQAFYRQVARLDNNPTEVQEMVWDVKTGNAGIEGALYNQGRYAVKQKQLLNFKNFPNFTKAFSFFDSPADTATARNVVSLNAAHYYTLRLKGIVQSGSQSVAEISFVSNPATNRLGRQGSVFIDVDTYQVVRMRATLPAHTISNNPFFKFKNSTITFEADLRQQPAGAALVYIKTTYSTAIGRPLKADMQSEVMSFTFFYNSQPTPTGLPYAAANAPGFDMASIKQKPYDAAFWRDNPVVKRTPLEEEIIKSFEQQKAFGTMLEK
ncbi:MAG: carboxypeptidase-like regulatory domain-containing protein [Janthinobacterium lividum]